VLPVAQPVAVPVALVAQRSLAAVVVAAPLVAAQLVVVLPVELQQHQVTDWAKLPAALPSIWIVPLDGVILPD
jgi:hypothetical protein